VNLKVTGLVRANPQIFDDCVDRSICISDCCLIISKNSSLFKLIKVEGEGIMPSKFLSYSITGQGLQRTVIYPYTVLLYDLLSKYDYEEKFHSTKQLGAIQYLLRGAHHTRYEYIYLQWTLIHQLKTQNKGLGLGSENKSLNIDGEENPTNAELLQCLSILTNMGHFPDTFSS